MDKTTEELMKLHKEEGTLYKFLYQLIDHKIRIAEDPHLSALRTELREIREYLEYLNRC